MEEKMKAIMDSIFETLTDEQKEKAKQCKTMDELMAFAGKEGLEIPDEALDFVSGGGCSSQQPCTHDPYWTCESYNTCVRDAGYEQCAHVY